MTDRRSSGHRSVRLSFVASDRPVAAGKGTRTATAVPGNCRRGPGEGGKERGCAAAFSVLELLGDAIGRERLVEEGFVEQVLHEVGVLARVGVVLAGDFHGAEALDAVEELC